MTRMQQSQGFRISPAMVKALRRLAHEQKDLDEEMYRARVRAVGCESVMTQHFLHRLGR